LINNKLKIYCFNVFTGLSLFKNLFSPAPVKIEKTGTGQYLSSRGAYKKWKPSCWV